MTVLLREMRAKTAPYENATKEVAERRLIVEGAIGQIAERIQRQGVFNVSAKTSVNGQTGEVKEHQENLRRMATILQIHVSHISRNVSFRRICAIRQRAHPRECEEETVDCEPGEGEPGTNRGHSATRDWSTSPCRNDRDGHFWSTTAHQHHHSSQSPEQAPSRLTLMMTTEASWIFREARTRTQRHLT